MKKRQAIDKSYLIHNTSDAATLGEMEKSEEFSLFTEILPGETLISDLKKLYDN